MGFVVVFVVVVVDIKTKEGNALFNDHSTHFIYGSMEGRKEMF